MYKKGTREFNADNNVFGDTAPGQTKWLHVKWSHNSDVQEKTVWEDKSWDKINLPENCYVKW